MTQTRSRSRPLSSPVKKVSSPLRHRRNTISPSHQLVPSSPLHDDSDPDTDAVRRPRSRSRRLTPSSDAPSPTLHSHTNPPHPVTRQSANNPNSSWINMRGTWVTHVLVVVALKALFGLIPGITAEASWTLTNVLYNIGQFVMFHGIIGTPLVNTPFASIETEQGAYNDLTLWEQMDNGVQFTPTKKFLVLVPVLLFLCSIHYTHYDRTTFVINFVALIVPLIGKLPLMHRVRLFGVGENLE